MTRGYKLSEMREVEIARGQWDTLLMFLHRTRSKHGPRKRRSKRDQRWWNRIERRSKRKQREQGLQADFVIVDYDDL